jgi:hypothetical protein
MISRVSAFNNNPYQAQNRYSQAFSGGQIVLHIKETATALDREKHILQRTIEHITACKNPIKRGREYMMQEANRYLIPACGDFLERKVWFVGPLSRFNKQPFVLVIQKIGCNQ